MERETGLEPATPTLARSCSTDCATPAKGKIPRTDLLSQAVARPVPSALARFTSVFGMGTGGSTPLWARGILVFWVFKIPRCGGVGGSWGGMG